MDKELRLGLHRSMLRIRIVEDGIVDHYPEQEMRCPVHLCIGQEAAEAGACYALEDRDYAVSSHRSHGHYLGKGGSLKAMMAEIYGKATGCANGKGGSMHLIDLEKGFLGSAPIVGSTIPIGVGAGFSMQMQGKDSVSMVFLGDGATEAGVFYESLNFSVLKNLPVVFVCENNLYSVYSPMEVRQPDTRTIADLAKAHGMNAVRADGNDVELVYGLAKEAVDRARRGEGPSCLELLTYRWREHCGPNYDNDIGYRTPEEFEAWKEKDPVAMNEKRLIAEGVATREELDAMRAELESEKDEAFRYAKESPFPDASETFKHVYAD